MRLGRKLPTNSTYPNLGETNKYFYCMVFSICIETSIEMSGNMLLGSLEVTEWLNTRS